MSKNLQLFPLLELLLEVKIHAEGFGIDLMEILKEIFAEVFIIFVEGF